MLRRGFKSQCEKRSVEIRKTLGLEQTSPLSAFKLADEVGVAVWSAADVQDVDPDDLAQLTIRDTDSWSAFTLRLGDSHLIVFNPSQSLPRRNSVVMHELAHIILGHQLAAAGFTDDGHLVPSNYDQDQEDEADWLGGALLLPRPALLRIRRSDLTDEQAMKRFMVSRQMLTWRFRVTGVDYQLANMRRGWR